MSIVRRHPSLAVLRNHEQHRKQLKYLNEMENSVNQYLYDINPEETKRAVKSIRDSHLLEGFRRFCEKHGLRKSGTSHVTDMDSLNATMRAILTTMRHVIHSTEYFVLLSKRFIKATKTVQRFSRSRLKLLAKKKADIVKRWQEAECEAGKQLRLEIEARVRRMRSAFNEKHIADLWSVHSDCWTPRETMMQVVNRAFNERRNDYLDRFREYKVTTRNKIEGMCSLAARQRALAECALGGAEADDPEMTLTAKRAMESRAVLTYPCFKFVPAQITLAELAAHLNLFELRRARADGPAPQAAIPLRIGGSESPCFSSELLPRSVDV